MDEVELNTAFYRGEPPEKKIKKELPDPPKVETLQDLLTLGRSMKFYKNVNMVMLWRIHPYLDQLNSLVGMDSLKKTIFYQVVYYMQGMHKKNGDYLHTAIFGSPGTGKTTVAKIIGKIYQTLGILSENTFKIAHRDDFIAGYLGQTASKTKKLLESCLGGVLFIDEAYSLAPRVNDRDSFSKEAIDTLTGFLSEHKNDFCCIIAGYEDDVVDCFFNMNKGLERRFPWVHKIEKYTDRQLYSIFVGMIRSSEWYTSFEEAFMVSVFVQNRDLFKNAGGDVETFLTKCRMIHAKRVFTLDSSERFVLSKGDIEGALAFVKEGRKEEVSDIPFGMYT